MIEKIALALAAGVGSAVLIYVGLVWLKRTRTVRVAFLLATVLGGSAVVAPAAFAGASSQATAWVVSAGQPVCVQAHVYINNTSAHPHLDAYGQSDWANIVNGQWTNCNGNQYYDGPYNLRTREDLYAWSSYGNQWYACNYGPFIYNRSSAYQVNTGWNSSYPCGVTWYFDSGYGGYYNANWLGGWTQTPNAVYAY